MRFVVRIGSDETMVVAGVGICFGLAMGAERAGYSVALGAFLAGSLVAESGEAERLVELVAPLRDLFAAVFFVSVGMVIDPRLIVAHWRALALLVGVLIGGKTIGVTLGALLAGTPAPLAIQTGLSLAQIGEFSFIIAGVGISTGAAHSFLFPVAVAVSAITTFTTPFMIRACGPVGALVESRAPHALAHLQRVYDGWVERVHARRSAPEGRQGLAAPAFFLIAGATCVAAAVIAVDIEGRPIEKFIVSSGMAAARAATVADLLELAMAVIGTAAMLFGARRLAAILAEHRSPSRGGTLQDWERSEMIEILQLAIMVCTGLVLLAVLQPFLQIREGVAVVGLLACAIALVIWRGARRLAATRP
jgi:CPA2 family monovalent cation:H+ antiporter-2